MGRKSNFSEEQMVNAVREVEGGGKPTEVARRLGIAQQTLLRWRARYSGMTISEARDKRRLEDENARLKKIVAQYALEIDTLKVVLGKRW